MIEQSKIFKELLTHLQQIPYLASRNIYRVAGHFLQMDTQKAEQFCQAIQRIKQLVVQCEQCCTWKEKESSCPFCTHPKRDQHVICVVETWHELVAIEKTGGYQGVYHVLGGVISPLDGISPEDLSIEKLITRVKNGLKEIILATNQTPEGEATASYIAHQLKDYPELKVTCLARGIPVGSSLEYVDRVTVYKALADRRPF